MTQDQSESRRSTRIHSMEEDTFDQSQPRIGRRESEPHSFEVSYIHDVLCNNFPNHHTLWDLHHYFLINGEEYDIQFDISFFLNLKIPYTLSSYRATEHNHQIPQMAINILSKSTWKTDLSENIDMCRIIGIPIYIIFAPFDVATKTYKPPFIRVYFLQKDRAYINKELRNTCFKPDGSLIVENLIDFDGMLPFKIGLKELEQKHDGGRTLYRMVFFDQNSSQLFLTKLEQEKKRADQEKSRADQEKIRADQEKIRADQEKIRADQEKAKADNMKRFLKDKGIQFE